MSNSYETTDPTERIARRERIAELIAKREAARGRPLTASEQIENFAAAMAEDAANQEELGRGE